MFQLLDLGLFVLWKSFLFIIEDGVLYLCEGLGHQISVAEMSWC